MKEILGDEYMDYNLVMASTFGLPLGDGAIRGPLKKLIEDYNLPPVVFHSFRHSSVTYKLKLNGGDIKAVQGDSGHAQVNMVTDVYSHILDDDRRKNAELFEEAFYEKKNLDPQMHVQQENNNAPVADEVDPELIDFDGDFRVNMYRNNTNKASNESTNESISESLNSDEAVIMAIIKSNPQISQKEMATKSGFSRSKIQRILKVLQGKKVLYREGARKNGYWKIL